MKDNVYNFYSTMSFQSRIFLIVQWILLLVLLVYIKFRDKGVTQTKNELVGLDITQMSKGSKTSLDTLYAILQNRKEVSISTIARTFKINEDLAMKWCKILEAGKLGMIDYPKFGGPVVKLYVEKVKKEEQVQKDKKLCPPKKGKEKQVKEKEQAKKQKPIQEKEPIEEDKGKEKLKQKIEKIKAKPIQKKPENQESSKLIAKEKKPEIKLDIKSKREVKKFRKQARKIEKNLKKQIRRKNKNKK